MNFPLKPALAALALVFAVGCNHRGVNARIIREVDRNWSQASERHDLDAVVNFYADDAHVLPPDAPLATGKTAIRAVWALNLDPAFSLSWEATKVDVASSGDLAYVTGTYVFKPIAPENKSPVEIGKMVEVFQKQADGQWKVTADIWNRDTPVPVPGPPTVLPALSTLKKMK